MKTYLSLAFCFVFVAVVGSFTGCGLMPNAPVDPKAAVMGAFEKLKQADSHYCKVAFAKSGVRAEFYHAKPDKWWLKSNTELGESESIIIGADQYYKPPQGKWEKFDPKRPLAELVKEYDFNGRDSAKLSNFKFIAKEKIDGKPVSVFTYIRKDASNLIEKLWIADETGLPAKIEISLEPVGSEKVDSNLLFSTTIFDYQKKIEIKSPVIE